jgi:cell wall-associated NlpC family hydrolase
MMLHYDDLIGKSFADMGRGPDAYDCWGLVLEISRRLGKHVPDYGECHYWDASHILEQYYIHKPDYERVTPPPELGDIVIYKRMSGELHFGVVVDEHCFLHAGPKIGVRKNRFDHPIICQLIEGFYRCKT